MALGAGPKKTDAGWLRRPLWAVGVFVAALARGANRHGFVCRTLFRLRVAQYIAPARNGFDVVVTTRGA